MDKNVPSSFVIRFRLTDLRGVLSPNADNFVELTIVVIY